MKLSNKKILLGGLLIFVVWKLLNQKKAEAPIWQVDPMRIDER